MKHFEVWLWLSKLVSRGLVLIAKFDRMRKVFESSLGFCR